MSLLKVIRSIEWKKVVLRFHWTIQQQNFLAEYQFNSIGEMIETSLNRNSESHMMYIMWKGYLDDIKVSYNHQQRETKVDNVKTKNKNAIADLRFLQQNMMYCFWYRNKREYPKGDSFCKVWLHFMLYVWWKHSSTCYMWKRSVQPSCNIKYDM